MYDQNVQIFIMEAYAPKLGTQKLESAAAKKSGEARTKKLNKLTTPCLLLCKDKVLHTKFASIAAII